MLHRLTSSSLRSLEYTTKIPFVSKVNVFRPWLIVMNGLVTKKCLPQHQIMSSVLRVEFSHPPALRWVSRLPKDGNKNSVLCCRLRSNASELAKIGEFYRSNIRLHTTSFYSSSDIESERFFIDWWFFNNFAQSHKRLTMSIKEWTNRKTLAVRMKIARSHRSRRFCGNETEHASQHEISSCLITERLHRTVSV